LFELVPQEEEESAEPAEEMVDFLVYRPQPARRAFRVYRTERGFRVTGTPPAEDELEAILRAAGARVGDEGEVGEGLLEGEGCFTAARSARPLPGHRAPPRPRGSGSGGGR